MHRLFFHYRDHVPEKVLTLDHPLMVKSLDGIVKEFGEIACFALQLLGRVCAKTERTELAAKAHSRALKLNPFLWQSYSELCSQGENVDPEHIFRYSEDMFKTCQSQSTTTGISLDQLAGMPLGGGCGLVQHHNQLNNSVMYSPSILTTPIDQIINNNANNNNNLRAIPFDTTTPTSQESNKQPPALGLVVPDSNRVAAHLDAKQFRYFSNLSPLTPSFGVMPLASPLNDSNASVLLQQTPVHNWKGVVDRNEPPVLMVAAAKKIKSHNIGHLKQHQQQHHHPLHQRKDSPIMPESKQVLFNHSTNNNIPSVRRSSRLFSSSNCSVKENTNAKSENTIGINNKLATPKSTPRNSKPRLGSKISSSLKTNNLNASIVELSEKSANLKVAEDAQLKNATETVTSKDAATPAVAQDVLHLQRDSVEGLMSLLRDLGRGCLALSQYRCKEALEAFECVPPKHYASAWVQSMIAVAHHERHEYEAAARLFKDVHQAEPHRMHLMEIYSTALWHLQKEVELSALAHDLMAQNKNHPVTWCVTGNCFSLHKEHDVAIKFFQRAVQVDPDFVYGYILLGHEFVITEELEKALSCFRTAIHKDFRHYNAWFGIGTIYSKQEKFRLAEIHYERALSINPHNSVIMVHIGAMQLFSKRLDKALATLQAAIQLEPSNPLGKFHLSRLYFARKQYRNALAELEELTNMVPKESVIYYLIGKIHKQLRNFDLGLMHFSWASDLDPKGANNQIKESFDSTTTVGSSGSVDGSSIGAGAAAAIEDGDDSVVAGTSSTGQQQLLQHHRTSPPIQMSTAARSALGFDFADDSQVQMLVMNSSSSSNSTNNLNISSNLTHAIEDNNTSEPASSLQDVDVDDAEETMPGYSIISSNIRASRTTTSTTGAVANTVSETQLPSFLGGPETPPDFRLATAGTVQTPANQGISESMDTPNNWNILTYDSDSF